MLNWQPLTKSEQVNQILKDSENQAIIIFKHSSRCEISAMVKNRLERQWDEQLNEIPTYFLDLLSYRPVSAEIADLFGVEHQSPQVLLILNGTCVYNESHQAIRVSSISSELCELKK